jgi:aminopeptidase N
MINHLQVFKTNGSIEVPWNSITRDYDNAIVTINLAQPIQANTSILIVVNYTGLIDNNPGEGTYMNWDYLDFNKQKSWIFATDFEGGPSTRSLVPCYDEPHYKANWYVTVQYPTDMVALSNALEERTRNLGNGTILFTIPHFTAKTNISYHFSIPSPLYHFFGSLVHWIL